MKRARYICIEGCEGVGKTTQTQKLTSYLRSKGHKVLQTKEPGTPHAPITMQFRAFMLDNQYNDQLTPQARELLSQAIRSIHFDKVIIPALEKNDFIIQDRGILSGFSYGKACGSDINTLIDITKYVSSNVKLKLDDDIYDSVIYLKGDISSGLQKALDCKQEFVDGDCIESKGESFLKTASSNMDEMSSYFKTVTINVDNKNIDQVFNEILLALEIKE